MYYLDAIIFISILALLVCIVFGIEIVLKQLTRYRKAKGSIIIGMTRKGGRVRG